MIPHSRPWLDNREEAAVSAVLRSAMLAGGAAATKFASALEGQIGQATLFSSGRQALLAALRALDLPPATEIMVQTYVCDAVIWAIENAGLAPRLCDIGPYWTCTPDTVAAAMQSNCGAILLTPPFGLLQNASPFRRFGVPIIHDLCQASPGIVHDTNPEELGDFVALSFHPTKYICAAGGGAIISRRQSFHARLQSLQAEYAQAAPFSDIQAAIGHTQYRKIEEIQRRRQNIFDIYKEILPDYTLTRINEAMDVSPSDLFRTPLDVAPQEVPSLLAEFARAGVAARRGVDQLAHRLAAFSDKLFPNAVQRFDSTMSLPFYPALNLQDAHMIAKAAASIL